MINGGMIYHTNLLTDVVKKQTANKAVLNKQPITNYQFS